MSKKSKAKRAAAASHPPAAAHGSAPAAGPAPTAAARHEAQAVDKFNRKAARKDAAKKERVHARRKLPNWPLLGLAVAGMALTGYLTATAWGGEKLAYCGPGSGCDTVQDSRWANLLGLPIAGWGFLAYATLGWVAWRVRDTVRHWQAAWLVAIPALGVSLYLTTISLVVIQASCFYCLASLGLIVAVVVLLVVQGRHVPGIAWPVWLGQTVGLAVALVVALQLYYTFSRLAGPEDPYLKGLAEHLKTSGALFYGASWCPHCMDQKDLFGPAAARLPYVECSPNGPNAPANGACIAHGVSSYPTWVFGETRWTGVLSLEELAKRTAYPPPPK
jgi:uncharacterized membrane protein